MTHSRDHLTAAEVQRGIDFLAPDGPGRQLAHDSPATVLPPLLTRLTEIYEINIDCGKLFWRKPSKSYSRLVGAEAGGPAWNHHGKAYWYIRLDGKRWKRSYLIFFVATGRWPSFIIDHINGNSLDDARSNLREATVIQNAWNHKSRAKAAETPMGIRKIPSGRYQARIGYYGQQIAIGTFDTIAEAQAAYAEKRKELFGAFA